MRRRSPRFIWAKPASWYHGSSLPDWRQGNREAKDLPCSSDGPLISYRCTLLSTKAITEGGRTGPRDGSEPSGAGPTSGASGDFSTVGAAKLGGIERCSSMRSPLILPVKVLFPALKLMLLPLMVPFVIGMGTSPPPKKLVPTPSTVPLRLLPSCFKVKRESPTDGADGSDGSGLQRPVIPSPSGTARFHAATCGRSATAFTGMETVAEVRPGELASTVRFPPVFVDCTTAMQYPEKAFRALPLSEVWSVGSPLPTPISFPSPDTLNVTRLSVIGTTWSCASRTSTANIATSSPSPESSCRSDDITSLAAGPVVSRLVVIATVLPL